MTLQTTKSDGAMYVATEDDGFVIYCTNLLQVYNMFHRQYMHKMLLDSATSEQGEGLPAKLIVNHKVILSLILCPAMQLC